MSKTVVTFELPSGETTEVACFDDGADGTWGMSYYKILRRPPTKPLSRPAPPSAALPPRRSSGPVTARAVKDRRRRPEPRLSAPAVVSTGPAQGPRSLRPGAPAAPQRPGLDPGAAGHRPRPSCAPHPAAAAAERQQRPTAATPRVGAGGQHPRAKPAPSAPSGAGDAGPTSWLGRQAAGVSGPMRSVRAV